MRIAPLCVAHRPPYRHDELGKKARSVSSCLMSRIMPPGWILHRAALRKSMASTAARRSSRVPRGIACNRIRVPSINA